LNPRRRTCAAAVRSTGPDGPPSPAHTGAPELTLRRFTYFLLRARQQHCMALTFPVCVQLPTYADNVALSAFRAAAAASNRYLLPAGPAAANMQQRSAADGQTDGHRTVS